MNGLFVVQKVSKVISMSRNVTFTVTIILLAIWTFVMVGQGYAVYSVLDPATYGALFSGDLSVLNSVSIIKIFTLGWCPFVLFLQFVLYVLVLLGILGSHPGFYVSFVGFLYGWSFYIFSYVFNFWGFDAFHFTIIANSIIFLALSYFADIDKNSFVTFIVIGSIVGLITPNLFIAIDHLLGWGLPIPDPKDYPWVLSVPYAIG